MLSLRRLLPYMILPSVVFLVGCPPTSRDSVTADLAEESRVPSIQTAAWLDPYVNDTLPFTAEPNTPLQKRLSKILKCPPEGNAQPTWHRLMNRDKNRVMTPTEFDIDTTVSFDRLAAPGDDEDRWSLDSAGVVEGYVKKVKASGAETCNCKQTAASRVDTHIELLASEHDTGKPIIVEVTPRWRLIVAENNQDWSTQKLKDDLEGHRVRFTGWMFFDAIHANQADNTNPGSSKNWRRTAWELHPVTAFEVLD